MGRRCHCDEVRRTPRRKQPGNSAFKTGLVAFDGEGGVSLAPDQILRQGTLGQQGIRRDDLDRDLATVEQRDGHADLVSALFLIAANYRQYPDFFWV